RRDRNNGRIGHCEAVEGKIVDAKIPAIDGGLGHTEPHRGLIVGLSKPKEVDALGLGRVIVSPRADGRTECGPLALAHTNEGAVVAGRGWSLAASIDGSERIGGINIA